MDHTSGFRVGVHVPSSPSARSIFTPQFTTFLVCASEGCSLPLPGMTVSEQGKQEEPGKRWQVGCAGTAAGRPLGVHHGEDCISVVGGQFHIADHSFTARPTLRVFRISVVATANKVTFTPGGTFLGDGSTSSMAGEVVNCQTVLCILWTPFVFCPSIAVIIISCIFTGKTLEAVWKRCRVNRRPHIIEVDVLGKHPMF